MQACTQVRYVGPADCWLAAFHVVLLEETRSCCTWERLLVRIHMLLFRRFAFVTCSRCFKVARCMCLKYIPPLSTFLSPQASQTPHLAIHPPLHTALAADHTPMTPISPLLSKPAVTASLTMCCPSIKIPLFRTVFRSRPIIARRKRHPLPTHLTLALPPYRRGRPKTFSHTNITRPLPTPLTIAIRIQIRAHLRFLMADMASP
jgi:hypothetical protein